MDNTTRRENIMKEIDELIHLIMYKLKNSILLSTNKKLAPLPQPKLLVGGQLKEYQLEALSWMVQLANNNLSGILADDMGLGKTIQTIAYFTYVQEMKGINGKHLIVVPKNVLNNWKRQLEKWNPKLTAVILPGTQVEREQCLQKFVKPSKFDVLIATYQSVKTALTPLKKFFWETLVVDEAHSIKNDQAQLSICLRKLRSKFCLLLTGTPLSNQLKQLWSLLNFIVPDIFSNDLLFKRIQNSVNFQCKDEDQKIKYQSEIAGKFKAIIKPFLLRRVKSQLELGLKQKKQFTLFVSLSQLQLKMYRNYLKTNSVYGNEKSWQANRQMQLRKICAHPYLFGDIEDPKAPPYGDHLIENSGKMQLLDKLLKKLLKQKHKILVFSQFVIFLKILEDFCIYRNYKYSIITGQSSLENRDQSVEVFSKSKDTNIFLISTRAGGLGLNLVAADVVILYDLDWNPQIDKQATDRAYRIGQKNSVFVFKLVTNNTIEERILQVQKYKLIWDELVIQKGGLAKIKAAEQKLEKINRDQLAGLGAEQIFKFQQNYDDKTIDEIIKLGQAKDKKKTEEIRAKLEKQFKTYGEIENPFQNLLAKGSSLKHIQYQLEEVGNFQKNKPKQRRIVDKIVDKYIQPPFYQLFKNNRSAGQILYELANQQNTPEELAEKQKKLLEMGFYSWTKNQYEKFIQANQKYLKEEIQQISKYIGSKTPLQVKNYSDRFFQIGNKIPRLSKALKKIEKTQGQVQKIKQLQKLQQKIEECPDFLFNLTNRPHIDKITSEALTRMHYNTIKKNGISIDEHQKIFQKLVPTSFKKVQKFVSSNLIKITNYTKIVSLFEDNSEQEIKKQMQKRYNELIKLISDKQNPTQGQKPVKQNKSQKKTNQKQENPVKSSK